MAGRKLQTHVSLPSVLGVPSRRPQRKFDHSQEVQCRELCTSPHYAPSLFGLGQTRQDVIDDETISFANPTSQHLKMVTHSWVCRK